MEIDLSFILSIIPYFTIISPTVILVGLLFKFYKNKVEKNNAEFKKHVDNRLNLFEAHTKVHFKAYQKSTDLQFENLAKSQQHINNSLNTVITKIDNSNTNLETFRRDTIKEVAELDKKHAIIEEKIKTLKI